MALYSKNTLDLLNLSTEPGEKTIAR